MSNEISASPERFSIVQHVTRVDRRYGSGEYDEARTIVFATTNVIRPEAIDLEVHNPYEPMCHSCTELSPEEAMRLGEWLIAWARSRGGAAP